MTIAITRDDLARMYPRALPQWLDAMAKLCPILTEHYKFTRLDWVHFAGQIAAETDGLSLASMQEDMRFSYARMLEVYSYRLGLAIKKDAGLRQKFGTREKLARYLVGKPKELADIVYGGREGTPWRQGSLYLGRGPTQITHLNNYKAVGEEIAKQPGGAAYDLVAKPELLATDPELGVRSAFADWAIKNLSHWACLDDCDTLSDVLNTGNEKDNIKPHGLARRRMETARAKAIWPADPELIADATKTWVASPPTLKRGDSGPEVERLQARLSELSFHAGATDGDFGSLTERAVVAFQHAHSLKVDGIVGPRTWDVLAATAPPDLGPREQTTAADLNAKGSETVAITVRAKRWIGTIFTGNAALAADDQMGLGIADAAIAQGERVKSLATRGADLVGWLPMPSPRLVASLALAVALVIGWRWFGRIEWSRVTDARTGRHLGR